MRQAVRTRPILILTISYEPGTDPVIEQLNEWGVPWFRVNLDMIGMHTTSSWLLEGGANYADITVSAYGHLLNLNEVGVIWYRKHFRLAPNLRNAPEHIRNFVGREVEHYLRGIVASTLSKPWVNSYFYSRVGKMRHLEIAVASGLQVPPTLVTNEPAKVREFVQRHSRVIVKPLSHPYVRDTDFHDREEGEPPLVCFADILESKDIEDESRVLVCPAIYQKYVDKSYELRITVVGRKIFAAAMYTQQVEEARIDWRRSGNKLLDVPHRTYDLPHELQTRVRLFMRRAGLRFACIDMIVTPANDFIFLEANPFGQWGWIEGLTGMPITRSVAELLVHLARKKVDA